MSAGRIEYKFLVRTDDMDRLRGDIQPYLQPDPFSESGMAGEYSVRSIYYDTPHLACYREKVAGIESRRKFRIRGYGTSAEQSVVYLEIKKRRDSVIDKHRAPLLLADLPQFLAAPDLDRHILCRLGGPQAREDARRFLFYYYRLTLQPAVLVVYDREAFFGKFDPTLRVTFDKNLRGRLAPRLCHLHDDGCLTPVMRRHFILELKFFRRSLPQWASEVIRRYSLQRMALSKYTYCLELNQARPRIPEAPRALPVPGYAAVWPV